MDLEYNIVEEKRVNGNAVVQEYDSLQSVGR